MDYCGTKLPRDVPFITPVIQKKILSKIYKNEINQFRELITMNDKEFWKLVRENKRCVIFCTYCDELDTTIQNYFRILIERYGFRNSIEPITPVERGIRINIGARASIQNILSYVKDVNPKIIMINQSVGQVSDEFSNILKIKFPDKKIQNRPK